LGGSLAQLYVKSIESDPIDTRGVVAWLVTEIGRHTLTELAERMNRSLSAVSLLESKVRERISADKVFEARVARIMSNFRSKTANNSITHA